MRKSDREAWNARSHRNRHNGRINDAKRHVIEHSESQDAQASDGTTYRILVSRSHVPNMMDPTQPYTLVKSQIVRV